MKPQLDIAQFDIELPPSVYADDVDWPAPAPAPKGDQDVDVAILGGGFTGLSVAITLAERGYKPHLYEAERIGFGASGRNGGQLCQGWTTDFEKIAARIPTHARKMAWDVGLAGRELIIQRSKKYHIEADLRFGYLHAALHKGQMPGLYAMEKEWREEGYVGLEMLPDRAALAPHINTDAYVGGLYDAQSGHLHPVKYILGLRAAAIKAGAVIHEGCRITKIEAEHPKGPQLHHAAGVVRAEKLVLAGNAYLGKTAPGVMEKRLAPVTSAIIATTPLGDNVVSNLLPGRIAVADENTALSYYRFDAAGRMLFGGRASYMAQENTDITRDLRKRMNAVFPSLGDAEVEKAWSGRIGITVDRIPHFGKLGDKTWFVQGFAGHGVALTGIAGEIVADAVDGDARRFDVFAAIAHLPFPGGIFRTPALALGMAYYKMRDRLKL